MIGHDLTFTETNAKNWIPLCSCGWSGDVEMIANREPGETERTLRRIEWAKDAGRAQHDEHCCDEREAIAALTDRVLADNGQRIRLANAVLQRRGRWGSG